MKRFIIMLAGTVLAGISVAMLRVAGFGADPFTCFMLGMANIFNVSYGFIYPIVVAIMIAVIFLFNKVYIGLGTIVNLFLLGSVGDIAHGFILQLYSFETLPSRIILFIFAFVFISYSFAMCISAKLGVSAYNAVSLIMADKKIAQLRVCRIITDLFCTAFGFFAGAVIGIGTVITALGMGPLMQWFKENSTDKLV